MRVKVDRKDGVLSLIPPPVAVVVFVSQTLRPFPAAGARPLPLTRAVVVFGFQTLQPRL